VAASHWKQVFTGIFVFLTIFAAAAEAAGEKWQFIGFTRYRDPLYLDVNRIQMKNNDIHSAWVRITPAENSLFRGQLTKTLQGTGKSAQAVKYLEMNKDIDCQGSKIRHMKLVFYDHRNKVLFTSGNLKAPWKPILAGSLWPDLQKAVCGPKK